MAFISTGLTAITRTALPRSRRFLHSTCPTMALSKGDKMPLDVDLMVLQDGKPTPVSTSDLFSSKKVALFTIPGAMTSTCQNSHVPNWIKAADDVKAKGINDIICLSVNDPFVMDAFSKIFEGADKLKFIADGGATLIKKLGLDIDTGNFGGVRSYRGSYLVEDGVFTQVNLEDGLSYNGPAKPETLLAQL